MTELNTLYDLIHGPGSPISGKEVAETEAIDRVRTRFPLREYCLVRDWIWVDLDLTSSELAALKKTNRQPALLYAHTVIFDSSRRFDVGDFVRTSPLHEFHDDFLFCTFHTVYVLLGNGLRKRASLETVGRIF
mgnify:CR=1 FL=1